MTHTHTPDASNLAALRTELPPNALRALDHALAGKAGGDTVMQWTPQRLMGRVVVSLFLNGVTPYALRGALGTAWRCAHRQTMQAAGVELIPMFRYAAFPVPDSLPEVVTVWRGVRGVSLTDARAGLSWSLNRDFACDVLYWLRDSGVKGIPLVLRREVPRAAIVYYEDAIGAALGAAEVVLDAGAMPAGGDVDGTPADWHAASARFRVRCRRLHQLQPRAR